MRVATLSLFLGSFTLHMWVVVFIGNSPAVHCGIPVNIGLFYDTELRGGEAEISKLNWEQLSKSLGIDEGDANSAQVELRIVPISLRGVPLTEIAKVFCQRVINEDVAVVILHTDDGRTSRYLASLASHFWIPVVGTTTNDPRLSDKNDYRSFLRTVPSSAQQLQVAVDLFKYTGNSEAFVIVGDEVAQGYALEFFSHIDTVAITVLRVDGKNLRQPDINAKLLQIKASVTRAVFLYCDIALARIILWSAKDFRMYKDDFLWIVNENVVHDARELFVLPSGIHAIRATGLDDAPRFFRARLEESYSLIHRTFVSLEKQELQRMSRSSTMCFGSGYWHHGQELYRKLIQTRLKHNDVAIHLDYRGDRANFSYETIFLQEAIDYEKTWVHVSSWVDGKLSLRATQLLAPKGRGEIGLPVMRAAVVEYPPLTMKSTYNPNIGCNQGIECVAYAGPGLDRYTKYCCYGLAIDVLNYVKQELEFQPLVYFVRDGNYGAKNTTSNEWNGIVRDLVQGEADISIDLMTNEARSDVVDFSLRWTHAGLALLVMVGEKKVELIDFSFFYPFTWQLWAGIIFTVNVYLVVLWLADRLSPYGYYHTNKRRGKDQGYFDLDGSMWYCWGVCFDNQFVEQRPAAYSSRAMSVCLAMFALLCLTSYTANLTAHLVFDDTKPDITGIRDKKITAPDSTITYGVVKSSYVDSFFELNQDPVMQSLFRRMRDRGHLVNNFTDGVDKVKNKQMDIFISEILSIDYEVAKQKTTGYPRLQVVGASTPFADTGYSYSFRKNSTWKPKFDLVINRLKAENKPSELYKKWVSSGKKSAEQPNEQLTEHSLSGVFFLGSSLAIVAIAFLFVENKLWNMGILYRSMRKCTEKNEREKREKFSTEIHRKLLDFSNKGDTTDNTELPDISEYMNKRRKTIVSLHSMYNAKASKSRLSGETQDSSTRSIDDKAPSE